MDIRKDLQRNMSQVMGVLARLCEDSSAQVHDLSESVYYHDLVDCCELIEDCLHNLRVSGTVAQEIIGETR